VGEAAEWVEALPIGNGHMGAMGYGGAGGRFDLSENTCWSGQAEDDNLDPSAGEWMAEARALLLARKYDEAHRALEHCVGRKGNYGTQLPMGRLIAAVEGNVISSTRSLDLMSGVLADELRMDGGIVTRESFLSHPDRALFVRIDAQGRELPRLCVDLLGNLSPSRTEYALERGAISAFGRALENIHSDGVTGVAYEIRMRFETDGRVEWSRRGALIGSASYLVIRLTASTDWSAVTAEAAMERAIRRGFEEARAGHIAEHSGWMKRCELSLPENHNSKLPTDERIRRYREDPTDHALEALFFQYGRYLLLNSSRPDSELPAALQGVWNDGRACRMEWTDDMHLDINTQMNYYPAEVTGLHECVRPLFQWLANTLMPGGTRVAQVLYGARGWCAHTVSNAHGYAAPGWSVWWGLFPSGGAWTAFHIWTHYLYTLDEAFLREYYPVLLGAARFMSDILDEDPATGKLLVNPSYSPENPFLHEGGRYALSAGSTAETVIARAVMNATADAAGVLNLSDAETAMLRERAALLPDFAVGKYGQLMEWFYDYEEASPGHRHTSHLLATHPFNQIDPLARPDLKAAVEIALGLRKGAAGGDIGWANWAGALLILYSARLHDGEAAGEALRPMIGQLSRENMLITHIGPTTSITGGIYELDGNTGYTAGVAEMLLSSYNGKITLLPAIPAAWRAGSFTGLRAQGGVEVSLQWDERGASVALIGVRDGEVSVAYRGEERTVILAAGERAKIEF